MDRVTEEQIEIARSLGACEPALIALPNMTVDEAVKKYGWWLLIFAADRLNDAQFAAAAKAEPWAASGYATDRYHAMQEASA